MSIGKASDFRVHDQSAADNVAKRPADSSYITLSDDTIADDASIGDTLGTLSITAAYVGTPRWEIIGQSNFAVNATTGVVTVAHALTAGSDSFKVKLRGTTPQINSPTFAITVDTGGGGGGPTPTGIIDFENNTYSWGAVSKVRSDLAGNSGGWIFSAPNLTANGYEGQAYFAFINDALAALVAGTVIVLDCTVANDGIQFELYDAPGFTTDGIYGRGQNGSSVADGNGGGSITTESGILGRGKSAFLVTTDVQSVSDNGGAIAVCDPDISRTVEPNTAGVTVNTGCIIHSVKFYAPDTDLTVVSAP